MDVILLLVVIGVLVFLGALGIAVFSGSSSEQGSTAQGVETEDFDEDDEDSLGVDMVVGDGLEPHLNTGTGIGIDLTDGSMTLNVGGMRIDTDGDPPGFKIF